MFFLLLCIPYLSLTNTHVNSFIIIHYRLNRHCVLFSNQSWHNSCDTEFITLSPWKSVLKLIFSVIFCVIKCVISNISGKTLGAKITPRKDGNIIPL